MRLRRKKMRFGSCQIFALSYTNYSKPQNLLPFMPARQCAGLVFTQDEKQLGVRPLQLQLTQSIYRVTRASAPDFTRIDNNAGQTGKCQLCHGQTVMGRTQGPGLVPGLPGRDHQHLIELQLCHSRLHQRHMSGVRWVECAEAGLP